MSETIYRVLHIFESDYGCEEHSEPMVDVVLWSRRTADAAPFPIPMPGCMPWTSSRVTA